LSRARCRPLPNRRNASTAASAGGLQLNYVLDSDIFAIADSAGGAAGLALEQTQFSRISGAGSANGTGGTALLLENGFNFANSIFAFDMEASPTCLGITFNHDGQNSFVSPYFACTTAVNATASTRNVLINPTFAGNVVNRGPQSTGIQIVGTGNRAVWQFPSASTIQRERVEVERHRAGRGEIRRCSNTSTPPASLARRSTSNCRPSTFSARVCRASPG